ncbi:hypothetical protein BD560DRAFT_493199 [Blakeslea trispora]|nr:hypothetical protein BD560DRAFT_493199 [Blakeslea trispora]
MKSVTKESGEFDYLSICSFRLPICHKSAHYIKNRKSLINAYAPGIPFNDVFIVFSISIQDHNTLMNHCRYHYELFFSKPLDLNLYFLANTYKAASSNASFMECQREKEEPETEALGANTKEKYNVLIEAEMTEMDRDTTPFFVFMFGLISKSAFARKLHILTRQMPALTFLLANMDNRFPRMPEI